MRRYLQSKASLYLMIIVYIAAGINHFIHPAIYKTIMPPWLPAPDLLILLSGVCEAGFAILLLFPVTRRTGAISIILLLIAVFPANIQMVLNYARENNPALALAIIRLPLQLVLIGWAYLFTKPVLAKKTT